MNIRPAIASDAPGLGMILSDWIDDTAWMPRLHTRAQDRAFVADMIHAGGVDTLEDNGQPVGFLQESGGHISALYLDKAARGRGGGRMLIDAAKARAPRLDLWTFAANTGAVSFYHREGFTEVERSTDNDEGLPDIRLVWERDMS